MKALIGVLCVGEPGVLSHRPRTLAIHLRVDPTGERVLPRVAYHPGAAGGLYIFLRVEGLDLYSGFVDDFVFHLTFSLMKLAMSLKSLPVGKIPSSPISRSSA